MFESRYQLKIKIVNKNVEKYYTNIVKNYNNKYKIHPDSGFDLISPETLNGSMIWPKYKSNSFLIDLGIQCSLTKLTTTENGNILKNPTPFYLYPRSSIYKTSYRLANSVGIIDCGYRGNLMAAMDFHANLGVGVEEEGPIKKDIKAGGRYWQLCAPNLEPLFSIQIVHNLDSTSRGSGGHGSTGL